MLHWNVWDEFSISSELSTVFMCDVCIGIFHSANLLLDNTQHEAGYTPYLVMARIGLFFTVSMVWPL